MTDSPCSKHQHDPVNDGHPLLARAKPALQAHYERAKEFFGDVVFLVLKPGCKLTAAILAAYEKEAGQPMVPEEGIYVLPHQRSWVLGLFGGDGQAPLRQALLSQKATVGLSIVLVENEAVSVAAMYMKDQIQPEQAKGTDQTNPTGAPSALASRGFPHGL